MQIIHSLSNFRRELLITVKSPIFIIITLTGNSLIGMCGLIFYYLERGHNPNLKHFIDAIWWSFSTATTTGNGNIMPVTFYGKILGILLMLMGMALFAMYTGLFAEVILTESKRKR